MRPNHLIQELESVGIYLGPNMAADAAMLPRVILKKDAAGAPIEYGGIDFAALDVALDALPTPVTTMNAGIPAYLTTFFDPKFIEILVTPNNIAKILGGEVRKGSWIDQTYSVPMVEAVGEVSVYGDYNMNGRSGANAQWEWRQFMLYQTFTEWGDLESERMGAAQLDWAARQNWASAIVLGKYQNATYAYGVAGIAAYGLLNDPSLAPALTPRTKAATGTSWKLATANEILGDVQDMFAQLQLQTGSNLEMDTGLTLALHSVSEAYLANTNQFATVSARELLVKTFPGLKIIQAPQYLSGTVYSCQLIVDEINGQRTAEPIYNEKMRAHRMILADSSVRQKKTQGTGGVVIYFPAGIVSMAGI